MKTFFLSTSKLALTVILITICSTISAQITTIWQGGKPGRTTDWECAANWSEGRVPDEFSQVIIPANVLFFPVIKSDAAPIDALLMEGGSTLTIEQEAKLTVLCETGIFDGISIYGQITNQGTMKIGEIPEANLAYLSEVYGNGIIICPSMSADTLAVSR
jgi:hypothetical protein